MVNESINLDSIPGYRIVEKHSRQPLKYSNKVTVRRKYKKQDIGKYANAKFLASLPIVTL